MIYKPIKALDATYFRGSLEIPCLCWIHILQRILKALCFEILLDAKKVVIFTMRIDVRAWQAAKAIQKLNMQHMPYRTELRWEKLLVPRPSSLLFSQLLLGLSPKKDNLCLLIQSAVPFMPRDNCKPSFEDSHFEMDVFETGYFVKPCIHFSELQMLVQTHIW